MPHPSTQTQLIIFPKNRYSTHTHTTASRLNPPSQPIYSRCLGRDLERRNPRPALIRRAEPPTAGADVLPVPVAVAVRRHAHALAADARDGLRRADQDLVDARGRDAAGEGGRAAGVELALAFGVVVWG